jgi:hypothetical protein
MRSELIRNAVENVRENAQRLRGSASPKKINAQAKSKVAGNLASQAKAKKTSKQIRENKNKQDQIMYSVLQGDGSKAEQLMSSSPRHAAMNEGYAETTTGERASSPTVKAIQQMIAQKERELADLHTSIS